MASKQDTVSEAFRLFDVDNDGLIPAEEVGTVIRALGHVITETELVNMLRKAGIDGRSTVNVDTFRRLIEPLHGNDYTTQLKDAFGAIDREGSGVVSAAELRHLLTTLGDKISDEEFNMMLQEMDLDKNGQIRCEDFIYLMTSK